MVWNLDPLLTPGRLLQAVHDQVCSYSATSGTCRFRQMSIITKAMTATRMLPMTALAK